MKLDELRKLLKKAKGKAPESLPEPEPLTHNCPKCGGSGKEVKHVNARGVASTITYDCSDCLGSGVALRAPVVRSKVIRFARSHSLVLTDLSVEASGDPPMYITCRILEVAKEAGWPSDTKVDLDKSMLFCSDGTGTMGVSLISKRDIFKGEWHYEIPEIF